MSSILFATFVASRARRAGKLSPTLTLCNPGTSSGAGRSYTPIGSRGPVPGGVKYQT